MAGQYVKSIVPYHFFKRDKSPRYQDLPPGVQAKIKEEMFLSAERFERSCFGRDVPWVRVYVFGGRAPLELPYR